MADLWPPGHCVCVTTTLPALPAQRTPTGVVDLGRLRQRGSRAEAAVAAAPVRHLPAALLEALQGTWGSPQELGLAPVAERRLHVV